MRDTGQGDAGRGTRADGHDKGQGTRPQQGTKETERQDLGHGRGTGDKGHRLSLSPSLPLSLDSIPDITWPVIPDEISQEAYDLLNSLLDIDATRRLGSRGAAEVKKHPFFAG